MSNRLYKIIDSDLLEKINIYSKRDYYYKVNGIKKIITESNFKNSCNNNQVQLIDDEAEWNNKMQSLFLNCTLTIEHANRLFGEVCCLDAKLGIGLEWKPENSKIKHCVKFGEFSKNDENYQFTKQNIEINNVNSNINFKWIIYIIDPGNINIKKCFGNQEGLILGNGLLWSIIINGNGSIFPIFEETNPNGPLWSFNCDFDDIAEDEFKEENIKIILNKSHKGYQYIQPKSSNYNEQMFLELISNAITILIITIKNKNEENGNGDSIDFKKNGSKGSILNVLKYFNDTLKFKINGSINELQESIKLYFDKGV